MKKFALVLLVAFVASSAAYAQNRLGSERYLKSDGSYSSKSWSPSSIPPNTNTYGGAGNGWSYGSGKPSTSGFSGSTLGTSPGSNYQYGNAPRVKKRRGEYRGHY